ncbi:MAG: VOC family protein [Chloroflexi bacterium]|nr:VOC family protein [Chloroflexota bacterium]MBT4074165.1 VOC family protein [Chloroflexota bacterium]MBT4514586.1 VOC family protein [Chloroflexota bacterium]MBT5318558.1 VOC family protein [Chloroflexota bacterium]MBT6682153.1 VOC family protein [Chloroflexota bacterium]
MATGERRLTVTGIGGVFFRSAEQEALAEWYEDHLGVSRVSDTGVWMQEAGPTVWSPFPADTDYFGRADQQFMVNFRVDDLDHMLVQLGADGVQIDPKREDSEYGRFAWVYDPEGNKIELWEPPTAG